MRVLTVKIDDKLRDQLETVAAREQRSLSNTARMAIQAGIAGFFLPKVTKHPSKKSGKV
jgi:predicted transcriptional regulator